MFKKMRSFSVSGILVFLAIFAQPLSIIADTDARNVDNGAWSMVEQTQVLPFHPFHPWRPMPAPLQKPASPLPPSALAGTPALSTTTWTHIGPAPLLSYAYTSIWNGSVSGRITGIAVDPTENPAWIYVAAAGGGVWKSTDDGKSWTPPDR
jgi:hypothetical protein